MGTPSRADAEARLDEIVTSTAAVRLENPSVDDCALIAEAKALYEEMYPQTRHGGDRKSVTSQVADDAAENQNEIISFCSWLAQIRAITTRTVEYAVKIGANIPADIRDRLRDSETRPDLYRHKIELLALANHEPLTQAKILDLLESGKAGDVAAAEEKLKLRATVPKWERQVASAWRSVRGMDRRARDQFLRKVLDSGLADDVLAERGFLRQGRDGDDDNTGLDLDDRVTAAELANEGLPGLPGTKKGIIERAKKDGWDFVDVPARGGYTRYYAIDSLPPAAADELRRQRKIAESRLKSRAEAADV